MHVWRRVEDTLGAGWLWRCGYLKVKTYCWLFQVILGSKNTWLPCLVLLASQMNVPWAAAHLKTTLWSLGQLGPCPSLRHGSDRPGERLKAIDQNLFQILMASVEHLYNWSPTLFVAGPLRKLWCLHLGRARADQDLIDLMGHRCKKILFHVLSLFFLAHNTSQCTWDRLTISNWKLKSSATIIANSPPIWSHQVYLLGLLLLMCLVELSQSNRQFADCDPSSMCHVGKISIRFSTIESTQTQEWTIWIINRCLSREILGNTWHFPTFHSALSWRADRLWETQDIQARPDFTVVLLDDLTLSTQLVHRPAWLSLEPRFRKKWMPKCVMSQCDVMGCRCCLSLEPLGLVGVPETACAQTVCVFSSVWINLPKRETPTVPQKLRSTPFDVVRPYVKRPLQNLKHDGEVSCMTHTSSFI